MTEKSPEQGRLKFAFLKPIALEETCETHRELLEAANHLIDNSDGDNTPSSDFVESLLYSYGIQGRLSHEVVRYYFAYYEIRHRAALETARAIVQQLGPDIGVQLTEPPAAEKIDWSKNVAGDGGMGTLSFYGRCEQRQFIDITAEEFEALRLILASHRGAAMECRYPFRRSLLKGLTARVLGQLEALHEASSRYRGCYQPSEELLLALLEDYGADGTIDPGDLAHATKVFLDNFASTAEESKFFAERNPKLFKPAAAPEATTTK